MIVLEVLAVAALIIVIAARLGRLGIPTSQQIHRMPRRAHRRRWRSGPVIGIGERVGPFYAGWWARRR